MKIEQIYHELLKFEISARFCVIRGKTVPGMYMRVGETTLIQIKMSGNNRVRRQ